MNQIGKKIADELIPVYETDQGEKVVDARELHKFLEVSSRYNDWINNRTEKYGFTEGDDFITVTENLVNGGRRSNHILKLDVAKELSMVENNDRGSQARKYFIEVEKRFRASQIDISKLDPQMQMFHHMFQSVAKQQIELAETRKELTAVKDTMTAIQETFVNRDEDWRKSINSMLNGAAYRTGKQYRDLRTESYKILEDRGRCDLNTRLRNLKSRLEDNGATKTRINEANKMDVIENDDRLKEIYTTIIKEFSIGSLRLAK